MFLRTIQNDCKCIKIWHASLISSFQNQQPTVSRLLQNFLLNWLSIFFTPHFYVPKLRELSKCIDDFEFGAFKLINVGTASLFLLTNLDSKGEVPDYLHVINNNRELRSMRDMLMSRWDGTKNLLQASCLHSDGWNFKNYCCCCTRRRLILCYLLLFTLK